MTDKNEVLRRSIVEVLERATTPHCANKMRQKLSAMRIQNVPDAGAIYKLMCGLADTGAILRAGYEVDVGERTPVFAALLASRPTAAVSDEQIAEMFHEEYERLAPKFGYGTRPDSRVEWEDVPTINKGLMIAVARSVREMLAPPADDTDENAPWLTLAHSICTDAGIEQGHITDRLTLLRDKLAAQPTPAVSEFPAGAIHNAEAFANILEEMYHFECIAGPLRTCYEWVELRRCLVALADYLSAPAAQQPSETEALQTVPIVKYEIMKTAYETELSILRRRTNIDELVHRFLAWPLPESVCSDACASEPGSPYRSGTNLLTAVEAKAMFLHCLNSAAQEAEKQPAKGDK
jgi:hypothetical protein